MTIHASRRSKESQWVPSIERQSLSVHSQQLVYLKSGGLYLNQNASHLQSGRQYAWTGTMAQAAACRRTFDAAVGCKTEVAI